MKNFVKLAVVASAAALCLVACAKKQQPQTEPETTLAPETTAPVVVDANTQLRNAAVAYSMQFLGRRYRYGGMDLWGNDGIDCSGFTMSVYRAFGVSIPRTAEAQRGAGIEVPSIEQALPGDLVCYPGHVGIYIGGGQVVHAACESLGIIVSSMNMMSPICAVNVIGS